jgi:hypothetical protein
LRCVKCDTLIPHHAKYCPKCGERAVVDGSVELPRAKRALPSHSPLPRQGKVFLLLFALAGAVLAMGIFGRIWVLFLVGAGAIAMLILLIVIGDHIGL